MAKTKKIEVRIGDRIAWRSGKSFFTGLVGAVILPNVSIQQTRKEFDPHKEIPDYLFNLGRDKSNKARILLQTTHKYNQKDWVEYPNPRITAINADSLAEKIFAFRRFNQRKDRVVKDEDRQRISWVDLEDPTKTTYSSNVSKKGDNHDPLNFEDIADLSIAGLDDSVTIAGL